MELHLIIIGTLFIALAVAHIIFPSYFDWKNELSSLSIINRQLVYVHSFFIALMVMLMGLLCITSAHDVISTTLGKRISLGLGIFWIARFLIQLFGYSSKLWKGKRFETFVHILFSIFWAYVSTVFMYIYLA